MRRITHAGAESRRYAAVALSGAAAAFQYPALSSAVPLLVSEGQYQRANGVLAAASSGLPGETSRPAPMRGNS